MTKTTPTDWLKFADDDLIAADTLMERKLFHLACFHAQQAAEKVLKAAIISLGQSPPKTHVLRELYLTVSKAYQTYPRI